MNPKASLLALLVLASSALVSASVIGDVRAGVAVSHPRHQNAVKKSVHGGSVKARSPVSKKRRSTGAKAKRCGAHAGTESVSSTPSQDTPVPTTSANENLVTPTTTPATTTHYKETSTPTTNNDSGSNSSNSGGATYTGDATYYAPGLNACGTTDNANSMIAAVSHAFFDGFPGAGANPNDNPICGKSVTATWQGKSTTVTITDKCMGCEIYGSLDFSPNAFLELTGDMGLGRVHGMTWHFN